MHRRPKRGEIWWHDPDYVLPGSVYNGDRPVIIVGNPLGNATSPTILVVPCTAEPKRKMATHVEFMMNGILNTAMAEQVRPVPINHLTNYKATLPSSIVEKVDKALITAFYLNKYMKGGDTNNGVDKGERTETY